MSTHRSDSNIYWRELDGLRALAITLVFLHHCSPRTPIGYPPLFWAPIKVFSWGWVGVDLFFVLSGFLISYLLIQEKTNFGNVSLWRFYVRRALRIWPLYFTVLLCTAVYPLTLHHWNSSYRHFIEDIILPFFFFFGNFAAMFHTSELINFATRWGLSWALYVALIEPFWSVCIEEQFYLFWPSIVNHMKSPRRFCMVIGTIFTLSVVCRWYLVCYAQQHYLDCSFYYLNTLSHFDSIMVGAGLAVAEHHHPGWFKKFTAGSRGWLLTLATASIIFAIMMLCPTIFDRSISIVPIMTVLAVCFGLLLLLTMHWEPLKSLFSMRLFTAIGKISFGIYVCHFGCITLAQKFTPFFADNWPLTWLCLATTAFCVVLRSLLSILAFV